MGKPMASEPAQTPAVTASQATATKGVTQGAFALQGVATPVFVSKHYEP